MSVTGSLDWYVIFMPESTFEDDRNQLLTKGDTIFKFQGHNMSLTGQN